MQGGLRPEAESEGGFCRPSACTGCGSLTFSKEWFDAFGVLLCNQCSRGERLIAKGNAKTTYLLTDKDVDRLGFVVKENPQQKSWTSMKLYLKAQVVEAAIAKHGSLEAMDELRRERMQTKLDARMTESSKRSAEGNGEGRKSGRQVLLERVRQQLDKEYGNDDKGPAQTADAGTLAEGVEVEEI